MSNRHGPFDITIEPYAGHRTAKGQMNALRLEITVDGRLLLRVWYSYQTPIAFWTPRSGLVLSTHHYSNTTGQHREAIPGRVHAFRVKLSDFLCMWKAHVARWLRAAFLGTAEEVLALEDLEAKTAEVLQPPLRCLDLSE